MEIYGMNECKEETKVAMQRCEYFEICSLFTVDAIAKCEKTQERFRETFCISSNCNCARKMVHSKLGMDYVPALMLPSQLDWARQILSDNKIEVC
jgi:hypothetical protein